MSIQGDSWAVEFKMGMYVGNQVGDELELWVSHRADWNDRKGFHRLYRVVCPACSSVGADSIVIGLRKQERKFVCSM
jgi:hypothetical protein